MPVGAECGGELTFHYPPRVRDYPAASGRLSKQKGANLDGTNLEDKNPDMAGGRQTVRGFGQSKAH